MTDLTNTPEWREVVREAVSLAEVCGAASEETEAARALVTATILALLARESETPPVRAAPSEIAGQRQIIQKADKP